MKLLMSKSYFLLCKQAPENLVQRFRFRFRFDVFACERVCLSLFAFQSVCFWLAFLSLQIKITRTHDVDNCIGSYQWQSNERIWLHTLCIAQRSIL